MRSTLRTHVGRWVPGTRSRYQRQRMSDLSGAVWSVLGTYRDGKQTRLVVMRERDGRLRSHPVSLLGFLVDTKA